MLHGDNTFSGGLRIGDGAGNNQMFIRAGHDNAFGSGLIDYAGNPGERGVFIEALNGDRTFANNLRITQTHPLGFFGSNDIVFTGTTSLENNEVRLSVENHTTLGDITQPSGTRNLTITRDGILTIAGTASYTGTTTVGASFLSGGDTFLGGSTLLVDGTLTAGGGAVTVVSGASLGGSGQIVRNVIMQDATTLSPGSSPGTLTIGDALNPQTLTVRDSLTYHWEWQNGVGDSVFVHGDIDFNPAGLITLNLFDLGGLEPDYFAEYDLFFATGDINGLNLGNWSIDPGTTGWTDATLGFDGSASGRVFLTNIGVEPAAPVIPEPGSAMLVLLNFRAVAALRHRRVRACP